MLALLASLVLLAAPCKPLPEAVTLKVREKKCFRTPAPVKTLSLGSDPFDAELAGDSQLLLQGVEAGSSTLLIILNSGERVSVQVTVR